MAKLSWDKFVEDQPLRVAFIAAVSAGLPPHLHFDKTNVKLPTPYGLFVEWARKNLQDDWASTKVPGGFVISIMSKPDAKLIAEGFSLRDGPKRTPFCKKTYTIGYSDSSYEDLARSLGYSI